jgi:hypothetical protein
MDDREARSFERWCTASFIDSRLEQDKSEGSVRDRKLQDQVKRLEISSQRAHLSATRQLAELRLQVDGQLTDLSRQMEELLNAQRSQQQRRPDDFSSVPQPLSSARALRKVLSVPLRSRSRPAPKPDEGKGEDPTKSRTKVAYLYYEDQPYKNQLGFRRRFYYALTPGTDRSPQLWLADDGPVQGALRGETKCNAYCMNPKHQFRDHCGKPYQPGALLVPAPPAGTAAEGSECGPSCVLYIRKTGPKPSTVICYLFEFENAFVRNNLHTRAYVAGVNAGSEPVAVYRTGGPISASVPGRPEPETYTSAHVRAFQKTAENKKFFEHIELPRQPLVCQPDLFATVRCPQFFSA